jgi:hypothetical protein
MDVSLDEASTSDADEREIQAANSDLYWDRVATRHLNLRPPDVLSDPGDDMSWANWSPAYIRNANSASISHPGTYTSSPAANGSACPTTSEIFTTPGGTGREPPTPPPVSSLPAASPSIPFYRRHRSPEPNAYGNHSTSSSPDPLHLLLSPTGHDTDDDHNSWPTDENAVLPMTSSSVTLDQDDGEEQRASSSSSRHGPSRASPRPINLPHSPSLDPVTSPAPPIIDGNHDRTPALGNGSGAAGGRYSMRTRQPRQMQPYAFDRLEYKHQLKYHPDAIVKLNGYRSPVESSPPPPLCSDEDDTDGAAGNAAGPSEGAQVLPRRKRKRRHRTETAYLSVPPPTAHRRTSKSQVSPRSPRPAERSKDSFAIAGAPRGASMPELCGEDSSERAAIWYPDVFNDFSSGLGSDEVPLNICYDDLNDNHTPPPRLKRRRVIFLLHTECQ